MLLIVNEIYLSLFRTHVIYSLPQGIWSSFNLKKLGLFLLLPIDYDNRKKLQPTSLYAQTPTLILQPATLNIQPTPLVIKQCVHHPIMHSIKKYRSADHISQPVSSTYYIRFSQLSISITRYLLSNLISQRLESTTSYSFLSRSIFRIFSSG